MLFRSTTLFCIFCIQSAVSFQSSAFRKHPPSTEITKTTSFLSASSTSALVEETKSTESRKEDKALKKNVDFDTILQTRRTINSFLPDLPNDWETTLTTAIQSATFAPNHKRTEPWKFHLLGPKTIRKICELNASIVSEKKGKEAGEKKLKRWLEMPGWLVVTCQSSCSDDDENDACVDMKDPAGLAREDYAATCCAIQNLCLSLHNNNVGTKWTTGPVNFDPRFSEIVKLEKGEYVVGTLWFGTPAKTPEAPLKKKGVDDIFVKLE